MIKFTFKKPVNPDYRPDEVTPEEKAALFPTVMSVVRITDREQRGQMNDTERDAQDFSDLHTFKSVIRKQVID